jgi:hypothetical protein
MCSLDDYETPDLYSQRTVKAKKEHKCSECGYTIQPGEQYEYVFGVWGGVPNTYKTCMRCIDLRASLSEYYEGCYGHTTLFDDYYEMLICTGDSDEAKEQVQRIREKHRNFVA